MNWELLKEKKTDLSWRIIPVAVLIITGAEARGDNNTKSSPALAGNTEPSDMMSHGGGRVDFEKVFTWIMLDLFYCSSIPLKW